MCVLILLRRPLADWPIVVAANRDESRARATEGPQVLEGFAVAGRDLEGGGTWLGVRRDGMIVALTNRKHPPRDSSHSRGQVVMEALRTGSFDRRPTGGFNLIRAHPSECVAWTFDGTWSQRLLDSGLHVILSNRDIDEPDAPESIAVKKLLRAQASIEALRDHLRQILASREGDICKHTERYGTVSASFVAVHRSGVASSQFWCAAGLPCETEWRDRSDLLRRIS